MGITHVDVKEAYRLQAGEGYAYIDVRSIPEYEGSHPGGGAQRPTTPLRRAALLHESDVARNDPNPTVGHRLIAYDAGLPKSVIRFSTLHARTAAVPCPAELRARRPSPMIDLYRKKTFSTRACRW